MSRPSSRFVRHGRPELEVIPFNLKEINES